MFIRLAGARMGGDVLGMDSQIQGQHHGIRGHKGSSAAQAFLAMVFGDVLLHLQRLFSALAARTPARNARGTAVFPW